MQDVLVETRLSLSLGRRRERSGARLSAARLCLARGICRSADPSTSRSLRTALARSIRRRLHRCLVRTPAISHLWRRPGNPNCNQRCRHFHDVPDRPVVGKRTNSSIKQERSASSRFLKRYFSCWWITAGVQRHPASIRKRASTYARAASKAHTSKHRDEAQRCFRCFCAVA